MPINLVCISGLLYMENGKLLNYILNDFRKIGYNIRYKAINCVNYGIPQHRRRIFVLEAKPGYRINFPTLTHLKNPKATLFSNRYKRWKTVRQAIGDLEGLDDPYPKGFRFYINGNLESVRHISKKITDKNL